MKIGGLIVAAGLSSRMGAFKPMLPLKGETILRRGVLTMLEAGCDPVAVVTGHRAEEIHESLSDLPVTCLYNPEYARSQMLDSVKLGLQWLVDQCDQVLFSPGDVCLYREETVRVLVNRESLFAQPVYQGQPGHPVLFSAQLIPDILCFGGDGGLAGFLKSAPVFQVPVEDPGILLDADTREQYERLLDYVRKWEEGRR